MGEHAKLPSHEEVVASGLHRLGLSDRDANTWERVGAILEAVSGNRRAAVDKQVYVHGVALKVKQFDEHSPWPFRYIQHYPWCPRNLPGGIFKHAYGADRLVRVQGVGPPYEIMFQATEMWLFVRHCLGQHIRDYKQWLGAGGQSGSRLTRATANAREGCPGVSSR